MAEFFSAHLYMDTRAKGRPVLNRHALLHRLPGSAGYATPANFRRLISLLDSLAFTMSIVHGWDVPVLLPGHTPESIARMHRLKYLALMQLLEGDTNEGH